MYQHEWHSLRLHFNFFNFSNFCTFVSTLRFTFNHTQASKLCSNLLYVLLLLSSIKISISIARAERLTSFSCHPSPQIMCSPPRAITTIAALGILHPSGFLQDLDFVLSWTRAVDILTLGCAVVAVDRLALLLDSFVINVVLSREQQRHTIALELTVTDPARGRPARWSHWGTARRCGQPRGTGGLSALLGTHAALHTLLAMSWGPTKSLLWLDICFCGAGKERCHRLRWWQV